LIWKGRTVSTVQPPAPAFAGREQAAGFRKLLDGSTRDIPYSRISAARRNAAAADLSLYGSDL